MRVVKFCNRNVEWTCSRAAVEILRRDYQNVVEVCVTDCFRRCLECRVKPFCRIQLRTIEAKDAETLKKYCKTYKEDKEIGESLYAHTVFNLIR